jgi:UDP-N-acetylglucosamine 2-epimerase (non-hydrolysing)
MLDQATTAVGVEADVDLDLMRPGQDLASFAARAIGALDAYLKAHKPDLVLVQGDTNTAFCAALAASYNRIAVGHIEAGLRTWRLDAPWPEEANRQLVTRLAAVHFAPTSHARVNLLREGVVAESILVTGNTIVDAVAAMAPALDFSAVRSACHELGDLADADRDVVLITLHRRESFGEPFSRICRALRSLAQRFVDVTFVYPAHLNPDVQKAVSTFAGCANIRIVPPLPYIPFLSLMKRAKFVITDSGGVQEEAPTLGKRALVVRDVTERPEGIDAGWTEIVGTDPTRLISASTRLLLKPIVKAPSSGNPFGDGHAGRRIARACVELLERGSVEPSVHVDASCTLG